MLRGSRYATTLVVQLGILAAPASAAPEAASANVHATRVYTGKCMMTDQKEVAVLAAVGVAVLSSLITAGINYLGSKISDAAAKKTLDVTADSNFIASKESHPTCFQVIRGNFPSPTVYQDDGRIALDPGFKAWAQASFPKNSAGSALPPASIDRLAENGIDVIGTPDFFFEGYLRPAVTGSSNPAYAVAPLASWFNKPLFKGGATRGITVTAAFFDPATDPTKAPSALFDLGMRAPGSAVANRIPTGKQSFGGKSYMSPIMGESQWISNPFPKDDGPLTLRIKISETRDERAFLKFVSDVFEGAKAGVSSALQTTYTPKTSDQIATSLTSQADLVTATATARAALATFCSTKTYDDGIAAKTAILKLQAAAAKVEVASPFATLPSLIDKSGSVDANDKACDQIG